MGNKEKKERTTLLGLEQYAYLDLDQSILVTILNLLIHMLPKASLLIQLFIFEVRLLLLSRLWCHDRMTNGIDLPWQDWS